VASTYRAKGYAGRKAELRERSPSEMGKITEPQFLRIPLTDIVPSGTNPRSSFNTDALAELAASIASKGVLEPIIVRPHGSKGKFEIVAGERRWRASMLLREKNGGQGVCDIPAVVRNLTDQQALEFSIVENLQRADVHFMDEAKGFVRLMAIDEKTTPELLAEKLGKSKTYVYQRLALNKLIPKLEELACHDKLSLGVALKLARLTPKIQQAALDYIV
jgi:ParB family transcriptional regulator, chromosome partitioning protein